MNIIFADKKLEKLVNNDRKMDSTLGRLRANLLRRRLNQLFDASNLEELRHLPGNYHELKGNRKGQWACELDQPYRLVFKPNLDPIPINAGGRYVWLEITAIEVIEIVNYHKEK